MLYDWIFKGIVGAFSNVLGENKPFLKLKYLLWELSGHVFFNCIQSLYIWSSYNLSTTSGFTAGFLVAGFCFGHQGVKIPKSHKPIFCLKLTLVFLKEQVGYKNFF
jgi:hypothetical protein